MVTNPQTGTNIHEIADGIYRINTPVALPDGQAFSFNQYLLVDEQPLMFHTGGRFLFAAVSEAIASVMPLAKLRYLSFSHTESDECGALNQFLAVAPEAVPLCSQIAAMVSIVDLADRQPRALADGETLVLGRHSVQWFDTPHVPHGWDAGLLMDTTTGTLFCGDLFTQPGPGKVPLTQDDVLGPSEAFRQPMDYYAHAPQTAATLARLAQQKPQTLACMHGSAWHGNGSTLLRHLSEAVTSTR